MRQHCTERFVYRKLDPKLPEIGTRLALTRRALEPHPFQMARLLGTDTSTWGTYEAGLQRIRADQALKLSTYGIPLDWVYDGKVAADDVRAIMIEVSVSFRHVKKPRLRFLAGGAVNVRKSF
jgi:transcriptional regulator with XRE-family HTH domain